MIPLWMTVISPVQSWWGWALRSFGRPWVAQRVWASPIAACGVRSAIAVCRLASLPGPLLDEQVSRVVDERDPGRVVAAIFEPFQAFDEDGAGLPGPRVSDDAAHTIDLRSVFGRMPCGPAIRRAEATLLRAIRPEGFTAR